MIKERLLKLAEHLESGKLSVQVFSLRHYREKIDCGFAGCAIGELPAVWPDLWTLELDAGARTGWPFCKEIDPENAMVVSDAACHFFDLDYDEFSMLFYQDRCTSLADKHPEAGRGKDIVAAEIRKFVELGNIYDAVKAVKENMPCR